MVVVVLVVVVVAVAVVVAVVVVVVVDVVAVVDVVVVVGTAACSILWVLKLFRVCIKAKVHLAYTRCSFVRNVCFAWAKHHFSKHAFRVGETLIYTCHCLRRAPIVVVICW